MRKVDRLLLGILYIYTIYLSVCLSVRLSIHLSIYLSTVSIYLSSETTAFFSVDNSKVLQHLHQFGAWITSNLKSNEPTGDSDGIGLGHSVGTPSFFNQKHLRISEKYIHESTFNSCSIIFLYFKNILTISKDFNSFESTFNSCSFWKHGFGKQLSTIPNHAINA